MAKERLSREAIAMRIAKNFLMCIVNLGIGIPTLCSSFVPEGVEVTYHTENGALGFGKVVTEEIKISTQMSTSLTPEANMFIPNLDVLF